jgi:putative glycosyltransferase (TIGR04372 family)
MSSNAIQIEGFWAHQFRQIKEEGAGALLRKLNTLARPVFIFVFSLICIPLVLIIRLIKPMYWVRFGWFYASRIGHFAFDVENYLVERQLDLHPDKANDIFFYRWGRPANSYFSELVKDRLFLGRWVEPLFVANNWIPGGNCHKVLPAYVSCGSKDIKGLFTRVGPQLEFSNEEIIAGQSFLKSIGIDNQKYICMVVRDSRYLKWASYHNYRDSDINTFVDTALTLAEKGYWIFRMGKRVHKPFEPVHPHIVDYANSKYRSDFLDIWLMANCYFCISTGTGLDEIARIFRRPAVNINFIPFLNMVSYDHVLSVPSKLKWEKNGEFLSLTEHLNHNYYFNDDYDKAGIEVAKCGSSDICNAVLEKVARLNGTWQESNEDKLLQERFWEIFKSHSNFQKYHGDIHPEARVGAHFLRNNPEWLN